MIDFKDEILQDEPRYRVRDNNGNILQDNVQIEQITPVIQEGTPINKATLDKLQEINNYELMTVKQEDISVNSTSSRVYCKMENLNNTTINGQRCFSGQMIGKQDQEKWAFDITGENSDGTARALRVDTSPDGSDISSYICSYAYVDGEAVSSVENYSTVLSRSAYSSSYYLDFQTRGENRVCRWTFDLYKECMPTFNITYAVTTSLYRLELLGSNDKSSWVSIKSFSTSKSTTGVSDTATSTENYRYYQLKMVFSNSDSYCRIYNISFANVPDIKRKFKNIFEVHNDFAKIQCKNVLVPSYDNVEYVTENTINNIYCDRLLEGQEYYKLRYNGEILEPNDNPPSYITGTYTGNSSTKGTSQTINLGFKPTAIYCASGYDFCFATKDGYHGQAGNASNAIHSAGSSYGYIKITDDGFSAHNGSDRLSFNQNNAKFAYIAFR